MSHPHHPRRGSEQFWPRKRSKHSLVRVRFWPSESKVKLLGFVGYKAGMTHLEVVDNYTRSMTKGEKIIVPATIVECPSLFIVGVSFYKNLTQGRIKIGFVMAEKLPKELSRLIQLPKKTGKKVDEVKDFDDIQLLIATKPHLASTGARKPHLLEIALGGLKEDKLKYARDVLGKELAVGEVFNAGNSIDVHAVTKGKGFQGTVKRFGVPIQEHKAEKKKRGIGTLGPWHPNRVMRTVAQTGKMGSHLRTEYNKQVLKIGSIGSDVTPSGGITNYGIIRSPYVLLKGSVAGSQKRAVLLTHSIRPNKKMTKDAPEIVAIARSH